jgi:hypothetical protein
LAPENDVCVMVRIEESTTGDHLLAVAREVFDLPPEHAAALAQGARPGEETLVAILPPRPARALLAAAEAWAAEHGAALAFELRSPAEAFSGLPPEEWAHMGYRAPRADPFSSWQRVFVPSLAGIGCLLLDAGLLWLGLGAITEGAMLLGVALGAAAIVGWLWNQRRRYSRSTLPLASFWLMLLAPLVLLFFLMDQIALMDTINGLLALLGLGLVIFGSFLLRLTGD